MSGVAGVFIAAAVLFIVSSWNMFLGIGAMRKSITLVLLLLILPVMVTGCSERWQGVVYVNKHNTANYRTVGEFSSLEECREAARTYLTGIKAQDTGAYECWKNCTYKEALDEYTCEKKVH